MPQLTITAPRTSSDLRIARGIWQWLRSKRMAADLSYDGSHVRIAMPFRATSAEDLQFALDASTAWNMLALRATPLPDIYNAGVRYQREPMCRTDGTEHVCEEFLTAHEAYARGTADCDDLGPWLAAQRRLEGDPNARAFPRPSAVGWHILVARSDGSIEDPSAKLGMPTK
jgi:hypothetical protein